jgi:hypothetical protein
MASSDIADVPLWPATMDLRIGSLDDPDQALTDIRPNLLVEDGAGRLFVGQPRDGNVRVFAPDGSLVRQFGSFGEGPGEFSRMMLTMGLTEDQIYLTDLNHSDVEVFDLEGRHVRTQTYRDATAGEPMAQPPVQLLPAGRGIVSPGRDLIDGRQFVNLLVDSAGVLIDTLFSYPTERIGISLGTGERYDVVMVPFGGPQPFVASPSGEFYWSVEDESDAQYVLIKVTLEGDTLVRRTVSIQPVAIPEAVIDSARGAVLEEAERIVDNTSRAATLVDEKVSFPSHYRAALDARLNRDGGVWIELPPDPASQRQRWVLHSETGDPTAQVELPQDVDAALFSDDHVWTIERDEFEVPYLVRFRIAPPS